MKLKDILMQSPFESSKVIAGKDGINNNVVSAMILEAVDIENWGEMDQIILTSYYALERLSDRDIEDLFNKMNTIHISALILKMGRLVTCVPQSLINLCNKYKLPLITIPKEVKYETILVSILKPIINYNANLLETYYQTRQVLNKLSPQLPTIEQMLYKFKELLKHDCQFTMPLKKQVISTNPLFNDYKIIKTYDLKIEKYMTFNYQRHLISYFSDIVSPSIISVAIPNLGDQQYIFSIFEDYTQLTEIDYMVIENAVEFLQAELSKDYTIKRSQFLKKNDLMIGILNTRYYNTVEQEELLSLVNLNQFDYYQGLMVSLHTQQNNLNHLISPIIQAFTYAIRDSYTHIAFYSKNNNIIFLHNFMDEDFNFIKSDIQSIIEKVLLIYFKNNPSPIYCHAAISSIHSRNSLKEINKECLDTTKMMHHFYQDTNIMHYDNLGIFKYFLETDSLNSLERFVPKNFSQLRVENPDLFKTLKVFLMENQNYVATAKKLFIHSKTVRYRIDKIRNQLDINFNDSEQIFLYQIAIRLYEFM